MDTEVSKAEATSKVVVVINSRVEAINNKAEAVVIADKEDINSLAKMVSIPVNNHVEMMAETLVGNSLYN